MKKILIAVIGVFALQNLWAAETRLRYDRPAEKWMEAVPIGNGRLSGMIYGGVKTDRIALNEISMWSGQPDSTSINLCGADRLAEMRGHFFNNEPEKGDSLGWKYLNGRMTSFGTHVPVGDLVLEMNTGKNAVSGYSRCLDLADAVTSVTYDSGDVTYTREYIASFPSQVIAVRLTSSEKGMLTFAIGLDLLRSADIHTSGDCLRFGGKVDFPLHGPGGVNFVGMVKIIPEGGKIVAEGNRMRVESADVATILVDIRTDYNNKDYKSLCSRTISDAASLGWDKCKVAHLSDYRNLFGRMEIDLGESKNAALPVDTRLSLAKSGAVDPAFDALFFQYGRYMLIASSRPNGMPLCANLQGIWNDNMACNMPWTCDYHLDINTQQNYWSANRANLAECNEPLFRYLELLAHHGAKTAEKMYGCDGWVAHTVANAWGYTAPGWGVSWGMNVTGGAWLATHLWSHYLYTRDDDYLRTIGYPLLKESAKFFMDYMTEDPRTGYLVTGPSISPENGYISPSGNHLSLSMMPAIDREVVYDIYNACIKSSKILGVDKKFRKQLENDIRRLPPISIGSDGTVCEWDGDRRRSDPSHRHSSHLLALFPLNQISVESTPELAAASRRSLELQTASPDWEDTEWSTANMLCLYARLKDGEMAHDWLQNLFSRFTRENLMTVSPAGVAMAESDIFSFDATEASVAGMCEMLLQSHAGFIEFLPALPQAWHTGSVKGICAEGGMSLDMSWKDGKMVEATVYPTKDCKVLIKGFAKPVNLKKGTPYIVKF